MRALFVFTVTKGKPDFRSDYNESRFRQFLQENEGKEYAIVPHDKGVSDEMRGYVFGGLIPFLRQISPQTWAGLTDDQVYDMLKKNFNYFEAYNPLTERTERFGQSVMSKSCKGKKGKEFIHRIGDWVTENYAQTIPDPEDYKRWRDSAPLKGEVYGA